MRAPLFCFCVMLLLFGLLLSSASSFAFFCLPFPSLEFFVKLKLPISNLPSILSAPYRYNRGGKVNEAIEWSIGPLLPDLNKNTSQLPSQILFFAFY